VSNLIAAAVISTGSIYGLATYYADGVMERVARYRDLSCTDCVGLAAMLEPEWIGQRIWITRPGERPEGPFLVVDCANREHLARQRRRGLVVEVDRPTSRRWHMAGPIPVRVSTVGPAGGALP
jgi:hypothetical protein